MTWLTLAQMTFDEANSQQAHDWQLLCFGALLFLGFVLYIVSRFSKQRPGE